MSEDAVFEYPAKFLKWYAKKANKYAKRYLTSTAEEREKMAYSDWCYRRGEGR